MVVFAPAPDVSTMTREPAEDIRFNEAGLDRLAIELTLEENQKSEQSLNAV